jgi:excisionase family DNA binding protein
MVQQFVIIDAQELLASIRAELARIEAKIDGATITPAPVWCGITDAARRLGVSPSTIRRKAAMGELEARGTGKTRQVRLV